MAGGVFTGAISGTAISLTISAFSSTKCKGTGSGTIGATPVTLTAATEAVAAQSGVEAAFAHTLIIN